MLNEACRKAQKAAEGITLSGVPVGQDCMLIALRRSPSHWVPKVKAALAGEPLDQPAVPRATGANLSGKRTELSVCTKGPSRSLQGAAAMIAEHAPGNAPFPIDRQRYDPSPSLDLLFLHPRPRATPAFPESNAVWLFLFLPKAFIGGTSCGKQSLTVSPRSTA